MKTRTPGIWMTATLIMAALLISPAVFAAEKIEKKDLKPKVTIRVDGLTCPFCAYGLEKRIKKISAVRKSVIDIKKGAMELLPKAGQHIDLDDVREAVKKGGFTPREIQVALAGQLKEWNGNTALSIVSQDKKKKKTEVKYLLKDDEQLKQLKASIESPDQEVFIIGQADKKNPDNHTDHPYTITIEKFSVIPKEKG